MKACPFPLNLNKEHATPKMLLKLKKKEKEKVKNPKMTGEGGGLVQLSMSA
jgi:hypothetical protein